MVGLEPRALELSITLHCAGPILEQEVVENFALALLDELTLLFFGASARCKPRAQEAALKRSEAFREKLLSHCTVIVSHPSPQLAVKIKRLYSKHRSKRRHTGRLVHQRAITEARHGQLLVPVPLVRRYER